MHVYIGIHHQFLHNGYRVSGCALGASFHNHLDSLLGMAGITYIMPILTAGMAFKPLMAHHALHFLRLFIIYDWLAAYQAGPFSSCNHLFASPYLF